MFERNAFLRAYNIDEADFKAANVPWEELAAIYDDYLSIEGKLRGIGKEFVNDYLYDIERAGIHSYRYRTKARAICWKRSSASAASTRGDLIILTGLIITSILPI